MARSLFRTVVSNRPPHRSKVTVPGRTPPPPHNGKGIPVGRLSLSSLVRGYVDENRGDRDGISRSKAPKTGVGGAAQVLFSRFRKNIRKELRRQNSAHVIESSVGVQAASSEGEKLFTLARIASHSQVHGKVKGDRALLILPHVTAVGTGWGPAQGWLFSWRDAAILASSSERPSGL